MSITVHALKIVGAYVDSLFIITGFIHVYIDIKYDWNYFLIKTIRKDLPIGVAAKAEHQDEEYDRLPLG